jgi:SAM-dependent methyltransferase
MIAGNHSLAFSDREMEPIQDDLLELTRRAQATHFWFRGFRRFVAPALRDLARGRRDLRLIDCGCGVGQNIPLLEPYGDAIGFDLMPGGAATARASGHPVVRADVVHIPFPPDAFDIATSFDVLQCVEQDEAAVREMARIVRPGGAIVLTLAALDILSGDHAEVWQEVRRYTPASARLLVEAAGLRAERVDYLFASLFPLMLAIRSFQRLRRGFRPVRADTDIAVPPAPLNAALTWLVHGEAALARRIPMPIGSSLLVVARKPASVSITAMAERTEEISHGDHGEQRSAKLCPL